MVTLARSPKGFPIPIVIVDEDWLGDVCLASSDTPRCSQVFT